MLTLRLAHVSVVAVAAALALSSAATAIENSVVPGAELGKLRHGTFPSVGNRTHVGVDLLAACGASVNAFADGTVIDLIDTDDPTNNFDSMGYMLLLQHADDADGRPLATVYLHLQEPPAHSDGRAIKKGDTLDAGQPIGKVGDTGFVLGDGCHLHFEVRHFLTRFNMADGWRNIYGRGDQRGSSRFENDWEDPEPLFVGIKEEIIATDKGTGVAPLPGDRTEVLIEAWGLGLRTSDRDLMYGHPGNGVIVSWVAAGSEAEKADLRLGDHISRIDVDLVDEPSDVLEQIRLAQTRPQSDVNRILVSVTHDMTAVGNT